MSRPREGWLSVGLLLVMLASLAWAVEAAGWLRHLEFLLPIAVFSGLAGTAVALSSLPPVGAVGIGALAGGAMIVWAVGGEYFTALDQLGRLLALRQELLGWVSVVAGGGYPVELTPYALGLGIIIWATGFTSAFAVFRHHRALDGVLLSGGALVANMSATYADLLGYLILFVLAALLLLLRSALSQRQIAWHARRLSQTGEVQTAIMRSGVTFAAVSVVLAWVLTSVAVAAPLTGAWSSLDGVWTGIGDSVGHVFGSVESPNSRLVDTSFGAQMNVTGSWESRDGVVLRVASDRAHYLRTTTYDVYTGAAWQQSTTTRRTVQSLEPIFPELTPELPAAPDAREQVVVEVLVESPAGRNLFAPGFPIAAGVPLLVHELGGEPLFAALESAGAMRAGDSYSLTAYVSTATEAELASAGTDYPPSITSRYLDVTNVTDATRQLALQLTETARATDPYHQARALADYLRTSSDFTYDTNPGVPGDPARDLVDHFLFDEAGRRGYCQYFASAMVVMARSLGLPARMAAGYAPSTETDATGAYVVRQRQAHVWAEIYFPGYGWEIFEATKSLRTVVRNTGVPGAGGGAVGGVDVIDPRLARLLEGDGQPLLPDSAPLVPTDLRDPDRARGGNAVVMGILGLAAVIVALYLVRRSRQHWQLLPVGDRAWRQVERATGRAGIAARPNETVYEYAGWLSGQIPSRRPEIGTVAHGKVWADYSGRITPPARQAQIQRAWRRLRLPLWLLVVRRRLGALLGRTGSR